jgi:hypothetical protein
MSRIRNSASPTSPHVKGGKGRRTQNEPCVENPHHPFLGPGKTEVLGPAIHPRIYLSQERRRGLLIREIK